MKYIRSMVGVVIGYAVFAISAVVLFRLSGRDPHAPQDSLFILAASTYGIAFAALGGAVAGLIPGRRSLVHSACVAAFIALGALGSLIASPDRAAIWSQLSALLLMAPGALFGGVLVSRLRRREPRPKSGID